MITTIICIALIGTLQFNSAISAAINYEPIKITVNEDFNAQPGQVSPELQEPGVLHQGANFYFKPQLNLLPSYIPSHIKGLISLIQQHHHSCSKDASKLVVEKDKLIEIQQPFMYPMSDISKETLSEIVLEKDNNLEIVKPSIIDELKPVTPEFLVILETPELPPLSINGIRPLVEEEVKKEESVILEESTGVFPTIPKIAMRPITKPIINYVEPKPITSGLVVIPEGPVLPPVSANDIQVIEEVKIEEPIVVEVEPKPAIQEVVAIPEAPVLPSVSLHNISSIIEEEANKEESVIFEDQVGVFSTIPEIYVTPIEEPIINYVEPKFITSELEVIPKAPVLPSLLFNGIPHIVEEEVKKEESIILEERTGVFPTIPEITVKPITETISNYVEPTPINAELVVIPEAPMLTPLSANDIHVVEEEVKIEEPIVVDVEPKPVIQELVAIPEAPVLPSLSLHDISSIIEEETKKEESIIFEDQVGVFSTIPEIDVRPIEEPIINYVEPKPITSELVIISEAPVLPPLSLHGIPPIVEEEVAKEESIILEAPTDVFPTIPEIDVRTISEPIINYVESKPINTEYVVIPEAPVLAPLSANDIHFVEVEVKIEEPIVVDVEPKPVIQELVAIPKAPVLPSLSFHDNCSIIEEEVKKEESVIFEKPTGVFPTIPEITVRPIEEPIINYVEPKLITSDIVAIQGAPVLPQLSYNGIPPVVEDVKIEEPIKFEESTGVFRSISEISARPFPEPLVVSKTTESFALENHVFPTEEVKIEVPILFEESIEVFPPTAEISSGPTLQESDITDSYVLEEISQPNPESVVTIKETLPPPIITKPSNNIGVLSYVPFVFHLSNRAPKTKKLMIAKPASVERFLLKKHPFKLPVTPFPKLDLNAIKSSIMGNKKHFLYPTSYEHNVVEKRIAPNMAFKKQNAPKRVKIYIRSNVTKGPSFL